MADLLTCFQCIKAWKYLQFNGLGDQTDAEIVDQMKQKHTACKRPITPLSDAELEILQKGISHDVLVHKLGQLKHDVAPGLGYLRNKHLTALQQLNSDRQMTPAQLRP